MYLELKCYIITSTNHLLSPGMKKHSYEVLPISPEPELLRKMEGGSG